MALVFYLLYFNVYLRSDSVVQATELMAVTVAVIAVINDYQIWIIAVAGVKVFTRLIKLPSLVNCTIMRQMYLFKYINI